MNTRFTYALLFLVSLIALPLKAQYINVDDSYMAQQLVEALVSSTCAQVSNAVVTGATDNSARPSYGYFTSGTSNFPFKNGIVISTGFAASAIGPNTDILNEGADQWLGDKDLENALSETDTYNATVLEFDFVPVTNNISFDYILASEEYEKFWDDPGFCDFSDGFAFLLKPKGSTQAYQNLAVIPNTSIPVKVTTVRGAGTCPEANVEYFAGYNGIENDTNFNGQTVSLTATADVIPGTVYHIKLVIADKGDTQYDSAIFLGGGSFNFSADLGPDRLVSTGNPVCGNEDITLTNTPGATSYKWFKNGVELTGEINATYKPTATGEYKTEAVFTGDCVYTSNITLEYAQPIASTTLTYVQCDDDNDGLTAYYLNQVKEQLFTNPDLKVLSYYTSLADANTNKNGAAINNDTKPFYTTSRDQEIYFKLQNQFGCEGVVPIKLSTNTINNVLLQPLYQCQLEESNPGFANFDLLAATPAILNNFPQGTTLQYFANYNDALENKRALPNSYTNTTAGSSVIYIRTDSKIGCLGINTLELIVPYISDEDKEETITLCEGTSQLLDAGSGYSTYSWNTTPAQTTRQITIDKPGTYIVTIANEFGCETSKSYIVNQSGPAKNVEFKVKDFSGNSNSVSVIVKKGIGSYEYSIDGINYQSSEYFGNLESGKYTFYVKDSNGCSPEFKKVVYVLSYPLAFTPNGDGYNDIWKVPYLNTRPDAIVTVFDRYGRVISQFSGVSGWDGNFNGKPLPATDYWFTINLEESNVQGHFALIR
jgi:gliding motility-associated-like protein